MDKHDAIRMGIIILVFTILYLLPDWVSLLLCVMGFFCWLFG